MSRGLDVLHRCRLFMITSPTEQEGAGAMTMLSPSIPRQLTRELDRYTAPKGLELIRYLEGSVSRRSPVTEKRRLTCVHLVWSVISRKVSCPIGRRCARRQR